jgi:hypothetical protein
MEITGLAPDNLIIFGELHHVTTAKSVSRVYFAARCVAVGHLGQVLFSWCFQFVVMTDASVTWNLLDLLEFD